MLNVQILDDVSSSTEETTAPWQQQLVSRVSIMMGNFDEYDDDIINEKIGGGIGGVESNLYYADHHDADAIELFGHPIENTSHQCSCSSPMQQFNCPDDQPLWWLVLRWMKMMLFKIARSYHAKPLLLVIAPLLFGIIIGFWLGRRGDRHWEQQKKDKKSKLSEWISFIWFRLGVTVSFWFLEGIYQSTFVDESLASSYSTTKPTTTTTRAESASNIVAVSKCKDENDGSSVLTIRETKTRTYLKSDEGTIRESDVPVDSIPRHVAVIMDGNRRYGKLKYGNATRGHWDGSSKLVEFAKWCIAERIAVLTVFAFSSENWKREPAEVATLMQIFVKYCDELRVEAIQRNIKIMALSTDYERIPAHVQVGIKRMVEETQHCDGMIMNICLSYGSRDEIVRATKSVVEDVLQNNVDPKSINEKTISERLLTQNCGGDPDVLIRTSGEVRISNFLLWQLAYTELFFWDKPWPAVEKADLLQVIQAYAMGRNRRYGK